MEAEEELRELEVVEEEVVVEVEMTAVFEADEEEREVRPSRRSRVANFCETLPIRASCTEKRSSMLSSSLPDFLRNATDLRFEGVY